MRQGRNSTFLRVNERWNDGLQALLNLAPQM